MCKISSIPFCLVSNIQHTFSCLNFLIFLQPWQKIVSKTHFLDYFCHEASPSPCINVVSHKKLAWISDIICTTTLMVRERGERETFQTTPWKIGFWPQYFAKLVEGGKRLPPPPPKKRKLFATYLSLSILLSHSKWERNLNRL